MSVKVFTFFLISLHAFGSFSCAPIGYIRKGDEARKVAEDTWTGSGNDKEMSAQLHNRFVKTSKGKSEQGLPENDIIQIPDDMFVTSRGDGPTEEIRDSVHTYTSTFKGHLKENNVLSVSQSQPLSETYLKYVENPTEADRHRFITVMLARGRRSRRQIGMAKSHRKVCTIADRPKVAVRHAPSCQCGCRNQNFVDAENGRKTVGGERDGTEPDALPQQIQIDDARRDVMETQTNSGEYKEMTVGQQLQERFAISQKGKSETIGQERDITSVPVIMFMTSKGFGLAEKKYDLKRASPTKDPQNLHQTDTNLRLTQNPTEDEPHHVATVLLERHQNGRGIGSIKRYREILTAAELQENAVTPTPRCRCGCHLSQNDVDMENNLL